MEHLTAPPMCNFCGGELQLRFPTNDDPDRSNYVCKRCKKRPTPINEIPRVKNLAKSYIPKFGMGKGPRTL